MATMSSWSSRFSSVAGIELAATRIIGIAADLQVQVGGAALDGDLQQVVDVHVQADAGLTAGLRQLAGGSEPSPAVWNR